MGFKNLLGTVLDRFQLGLTGPMLKAESDQIAARGAGDTSYAAIRAALVRVFGDAIELNAGATGSGANRRMRLMRPATGMTTDIDVVLPTGTPSPGQVLRVAAYASGTVTLEYGAGGGGSPNAVLVDETDLAFGTSSPLALLTKPANAIVERVKVVIDTPFNGTPSVSVGVTGANSKYAAASHINLKAVAGTVFELDYGVDGGGTTEDIIATYAAGGATAGAARILIAYVLPS